ncbi:nucleotidyl transferase AbiEii/AbiGii toxin family protein [Gilvimarinus sp. SDUM040013]|uniref:Nucleotidyl transferase AbiEii/AbiGii toxin family protein n=1 Tax=Gilvimarinus gilvus TaxID=3058038 RepID=A0ABU4S540_9GAMM|nr:nucleotidyl transferase AbiEii/AbiGii toxin family protein [Gilvimarinus sp. SDUM040013]MDO3384763.1 nucleotidyl transferase AbiEii/AbiGii toxin family protein [Gilvimarinus sp. SDUM040013]MDX6850419.1 nucleotidyl transferase AbiEii/AbiGii toxin family protein [Gilvimarinus sp. SDUM040013]
MNMARYDFNRRQLVLIAQGLGDLLHRVVFVGGCTTVLLVDEVAYSGVRQTEDVDVIVDLATYFEYQAFSAALRERGFVEDVSGPICSWLYNSRGARVTLDVMSSDSRAMGFTNKWYKQALDHTQPHNVANDLEIQVVSPVYFLATKFEAFLDRGEGNFYSHDLEDIVFVLENRSGLIRELEAAPEDVKQYLSAQATSLFNDEFLNVLPGLVIDDRHSPAVVTDMLRVMASWF